MAHLFMGIVFMEISLSVVYTVCGGDWRIGVHFRLFPYTLPT